MNISKFLSGWIPFTSLNQSILAAAWSLALVPVHYLLSHLVADSGSLFANSFIYIVYSYIRDIFNIYFLVLKNLFCHNIYSTLTEQMIVRRIAIEESKVTITLYITLLLNLVVYYSYY